MAFLIGFFKQEPKTNVKRKYEKLLVFRTNCP